MRMTPVFPLMLFCLAFTTPVFSQKKITYGITAGWNSSSISGSFTNLPLSFSNDSYTGRVTSVSFNKKNGVIGGFYMEIPIGKQSFFHPELLYMMMGSKFTMNMEVDQPSEGNIFPVPINGKLKFGYVALPLLYKYKLEDDRPGGWGIYGGIQPAYIASSAISIEGSRVENVNVVDKRIDVQGIAGVDFFLDNGWGATCRYQIGILTRRENIGPITTEHIRNNALSISLCYRFHHSKRRVPSK